MHELSSQLFKLKLTCLVVFSHPDCFALTTFVNFITQKSSSLLTKIQNALLSLEVTFKAILKTRSAACSWVGWQAAGGCHVPKEPSRCLAVRCAVLQGTRKSSRQWSEVFSLTGFPNFTLGPVYIQPFVFLLQHLLDISSHLVIQKRIVFVCIWDVAW